MTFSQIRKYIARNLGLLSSDNETIIEGNINKAGLDDEINRVYREIICQQLMTKSPDQFTVESRINTFRDSFTVASVDTINKQITSSTSVFGNADVGFYLQNPTENNSLLTNLYINSTTLQTTTTPSSTWVGDTAYILSNIIILDGDMEDFKEIVKFEIKYNANDQVWTVADKLGISNFQDNINLGQNFQSKPIFCLTTIKVNDVMKSCIKFFPSPLSYNGQVKITYTQLPSLLLEEDQKPVLDNIGISEAIINGVTAWGWKILGDFNKAQAYEENNILLGGVVPKGLTLINSKYNPEKANNIKYNGF